MKSHFDEHVFLWRIYCAQVLNKPAPRIKRIEAYVRDQMQDYYERQIDDFGFLTRDKG